MYESRPTVIPNSTQRANKMSFEGSPIILAKKQALGENKKLKKSPGSNKSFEDNEKIEFKDEEIRERS